jgi:hypothetical protein
MRHRPRDRISRTGQSGTTCLRAGLARIEIWLRLLRALQPRTRDMATCPPTYAHMIVQPGAPRRARPRADLSSTERFRINSSSTGQGRFRLALYSKRSSGKALLSRATVVRLAGHRTAGRPAARLRVAASRDFVRGRRTNAATDGRTDIRSTRGREWLTFTHDARSATSRWSGGTSPTSRTARRYYLVGHPGSRRRGVFLGASSTIRRRRSHS